MLMAARVGGADRRTTPNRWRTRAEGGIMSGMRVAHCQFEPWCGDFEHNLARFEEGIAWADRERVEIVSFPECFLTGYPDTEEAARSGAFPADGETMMRVLNVSSQHEALGIVGFNE